MFNKTRVHLTELLEMTNVGRFRTRVVTVIEF